MTSPLPPLTGGILPTSAVNSIIDRVNTLLSTTVALSKTKSSDETIVSDATANNDSELFILGEANTNYDLELLAFQNSTVGAGFRISFALPAGATWYGGYFLGGTSLANMQFVYISASGTAGITGAGGFSICYVRANIAIGSTSGLVNFQWAQNASTAANTTVAAGSRLILTRR